MQVVLPETDIEKQVYQILTTDEYWCQKKGTIQKISNGQKGIVYDIFKKINDTIHPNYSNMKDLNEYLQFIYEESSKNTATCKKVIDNVIRKYF